MKTYDQVICNFQANEIYGGATCPFCEKRSVLIVEKNPNGNHTLDRFWRSEGCDHVRGLLSGGDFEIVIEFRKDK